MKNSWIIIIMMSLTLSCSMRPDRAIGSYQIVDSIMVSEALQLAPMRIFHSGILAVNMYEKSLVLLDFSGNIIASYEQKGRGPGEFINPNQFDTFNNSVFVLDKGKNKVIELEYCNEEATFNFVNEFKVEGNVFNITIIDRQNILISTWGDKYNVKLYDNYGNIIERMSLSKIKEIQKERDLWSNVVYVKADKHNIIVSSLIDMELMFYNINSQNEFEFINDCSIPCKNESRVTDKKKQFVGIGESFLVCGEFFVNIHPELTEGKIIFKVYDKKGNYLGFYSLEDYITNSICSLSFSDDGKSLWIMDFENNDRIIYVANKIK